MQLGIFAKTFPGTSPHPVLSAVRDAGYAVAQYNLACSGLASVPDHIPADVIADITSAVAATGVTLPALSATYNMIHPSTEERKVGHARLAVVMQAAQQLCIPLVTLCTGTRNPKDQWTHHPDNTSAEAWRDLRASMDVALTLAERYDLQLGVEPEHANVVNSAESAKRLINEVKNPRLKIIFDPTNLFEREDKVSQRRIISTAIDLLGEHIALAHAKDRTADGIFTAAGTGVLDYRHFMAALRRISFEGPVITHGLEAREAAQVARFLREVMAA